MKSNSAKITSAIGFIDDDLIIAADTQVITKKFPLAKLIAIAACLCLITVVPFCFAIAVKQNNDSVDTDVASEVTHQSDTVIEPTTDLSDNNIDPFLKYENEISLPVDLDKMIWNESNSVIENDISDTHINKWRMSYSLFSALDSADDNEYIAVKVQQLDIKKFFYNGKSLNTISDQIKNKELHLRKMLSLLKYGDCLKYGELIYTQGSPDGIKWTKHEYDQKISLIGKGLLSLYIVNGEFLRTRAEEATAVCYSEMSALLREHDNFVNAYHLSYMCDARDAFLEAGICATIKNRALFIFIQKDDLNELDIKDKELFFLSLANRRNYEYDRKNTPIFDYGITGFEYDKFMFLTSTYNGVYGDNAVIDNLNRLIDKTQFNYDKLLIEIHSSMTLYENFFPDIKYESISSRSGITRITVKFENINLEALRRISLSEYVELIHISSPSTLVVENK